MGFFLSLGGVNAAAFIVCSVVGFLVGSFLPEGAWATYGSMLVSYHLFLAWLVITADHETGFSMPLAQTVVTHLACLAVIVGFGMLRHAIPLFGVARYLIPAMAPFERTWLFSGSAKKKEVPVPAAAPAIPATPVRATAEDYDAWLRHLAQRNPRSTKSGMTVKDEYDQFMLARGSTRTTVSSNGNRL